MVGILPCSWNRSRGDIVYLSVTYSTVIPQKHGIMSFSKVFTNRFFENLNSSASFAH